MKDLIKKDLGENIKFLDYTHDVKPEGVKSPEKKGEPQ